jgi:hypothetical protein
VEDILADIDADDRNLGTGFGGFAVCWHGQLLCSGYALRKRREGNRRSIPLAGDLCGSASLGEIRPPGT